MTIARPLESERTYCNDVTHLTNSAKLINKAVVGQVISLE